MKSESAFIPDNISAISNASRQRFVQNLAHQSTEFHPDSTDNLVEEILRQRADRLKKEQNPADNGVSSLKIEQEGKESSHCLGHEQNKSESKHEELEARQLNSSKDEFQLGERLNNHSKGTINQSSFKQKESAHRNLEVQDRIEVLNNQTNQLSQHENDENPDKDHQEDSHKFNLPQFDKISDRSVQHNSSQEKSLQLNLSLSPSERRHENYNRDSTDKEKESDQSLPENKKLDFSSNKLEDSRDKLGEENKSQRINQSLRINQSQQHSKVKQQASSNNSNHLIHQEIGANESKIQIKNSSIHAPISIYTEKKGFYDFTPIAKKNETDIELVKAITEHLNTFDKIQNEEFSHQKTFRKSEKYNVAEIQDNAAQIQEMEDLKKSNHLEEFETEYSENIRETKILEHRFESNLQFEIVQLKEMIALYEALIVNEQCKQSRRDIKQFEMRNRREKIALRAASYTKKFNFHSPITKNNDKPIQFRTKFVISPKLADQYHETKRKIADEKKLHVELEDKYQVLSDYYDMMKQKKIQSYHQTLKEFEYNSRLQKYETVKNGFFKKTEMNSMKSIEKAHSQYEFNKTKRTIEIENAEVPYYQVLKFKIDINKDMILEFEVWNLSKLKKLRDESNLLRKEIQYVDQQIHDIDNTFLKVFSVRQVKSSSKERFSSPNPRYQLVGSPAKSFTKSPINRLRRPEKAFTSPQKNDQSNTNSFKDYQSPANKTSFKREKPADQMLLINSVQLEPSKRKAIRILEQMDDYGFGPIQQQSKVIDDNPTFIKKQPKKITIAVPKPQSRSTSKSKNLVRTRSKEIRTQTNLNKSKGSNKAGKMSQQASPRKAKAESQYYTSMEDLYNKAK